MRQTPIPTDQAPETLDPNLIAEVTAYLMTGGTAGQLKGWTAQQAEELYAAGYALYEEMRYAEAKKVFAWLLFHMPHEPRYHCAFGHTLGQLNDYRAATAHYLSALMLNSADHSSALYMCEGLLKLGLKEEAIDELKSLLARMEEEAEHPTESPSSTASTDTRSAIRLRAQALLNSLTPAASTASTAAPGTPPPP